MFKFYILIKYLLYLIVNLYNLWNQNNIVIGNKEPIKQNAHEENSNFMQ
jgi:hypothetical protein